MEPVVNYRVSRKISVAEHLSDPEYMDFLDGYASFCSSQPEAERGVYCASQIRSVDREMNSIIVTYNNRSQFMIEMPRAEMGHGEPMNA